MKESKICDPQPRKYSIYGLGSAIVDTQVKVSETFLSDANIEKGIMTLVDESRQQKLLEMLALAGLPLERTCGGSVCNSVVAASSLGASTFFSGKVANDEDGDLFISDLTKAGVTSNTTTRQPGITGKCLVMVTDDAERTMNTFLGSSETLSWREIDQSALKNSEWLYVEGYLVTDKLRAKITRDVVEFAKSNGVKIAISLSDPFVADSFGDSLREVIGSSVDLIFCNKDEALAFTSTSNLKCALEELKPLARTFAVTDGANGAVTFNGLSVNWSNGISVDALDTNGAGDMFAGCFLFAICSGKQYDWAANFANHCAARVVTQFGPRLELETFSKIKKQFWQQGIPG